jgi:hypothetical protein
MPLTKEEKGQLFDLISRDQNLRDNFINADDETLKSSLNHPKSKPHLLNAIRGPLSDNSIKIVHLLLGAGVDANKIYEIDTGGRNEKQTPWRIATDRRNNSTNKTERKILGKIISCINWYDLSDDDCKVLNPNNEADKKEIEKCDTTSFVYKLEQSKTNSEILKLLGLENVGERKKT